MLYGNMLAFEENTLFKSLGKDYMPFSKVYEEIIDFVRKDRDCAYRISIGTDSQVATSTMFVTCIHVHRIGKGAIGFLHRHQMQRPLRNLREKIYYETCATLQLAYLFDDERIMKIRNLLANKSYKDIYFEIHIDIGKKGTTKSLINEMIGMTKGLSFVPRIKPDSYCASSFADRFTKAI